MLSCILAAGIGASVFWVIQTASGSTLSFVGAANKVVVVILGAVLFDAKISSAGWVGVALGAVAGFWFAFAKAAAAKAANRAAPESAGKSKLFAEEEEGDESLGEILLEKRQSSSSLEMEEKG